MAEFRDPVSTKPADISKRGQIGLFAAMSIGIGGMVGAGIFSILGVAAQTSGTALWASFVIGGIVALLSTYSYAKLGARYPSAGGPVEFLVQGFGDGILSGGINIYMWIGYIIALALYAHGFAGYFQTFFPHYASPLLGKITAAGIVVLFTLVNFIGAGMVGRAESANAASGPRKNRSRSNGRTADHPNTNRLVVGQTLLALANRARSCNSVGRWYDAILLASDKGDCFSSGEEVSRPRDILGWNRSPATSESRQARRVPRDGAGSSQGVGYWPRRRDRPMHVGTRHSFADGRRVF